MCYQIHQNGIPDRLVSFEGKEYRWLGGTNYLNIGTHPLFQEKLQEGIRIFNQNWGSSRLNNYRMDVWENLEDVLANRFDVEAAALCSSGLLAGQTVMQYFAQKYPAAAISLAPKTHPALWRHPHLPAPGEFSAWEKDAQILCMDGIGAPWVEEFLTGFEHQLSDSQILIVDESHRLGIVSTRIQTSAHLIQTSSLSKAFGIPAGIILGSKEVITAIKTDPFWVGGSPANPAYVYACLHAQEAYDERINQSQALAKAFTQNTLAVNYIIDYPAFSSADPALFAHLKSHGFLCNQFAYPDPKASPICKAILPACMQIQDIEDLSQALNSYEKA
jgi:7-keto-8-aminopelargonate synthetase-like enzyme